MVGEQPRLELLDHLDLQHTEILGGTFTDWLERNVAMGAYKLTNLIVKEVSMPFLRCITLAVWQGSGAT